MKHIALAMMGALMFSTSNAAVIELGSYGARSDQSGWSTTLWQSDVNQGPYAQAPARSSFNQIYEFQLTQPALIFVSQVVSSVIPMVGKGTLAFASAVLEKRQANGSWQALVGHPNNQRPNADSFMWSFFDSRRPDGSGFDTNNPLFDSIGSYRFTVTAQAAPGEILHANSYISANWTLQPNAPLIAQPVPEPETYLLLGIGLSSLILARRRKAIRA
ncbi:PEP-CTERM sorting domain-containing protein [Chitinibacter tainanensis]|uniref:PEP-CTERM sorting domain-containing protein n=1 Tax=Chitinibacter tainanensis TaxID=230667 RepID=UPI000491C72A|nr:PEP-CTERM sorting domain-containing protein [Chitinibacter tainanensis]